MLSVCLSVPVLVVGALSIPLWLWVSLGWAGEDPVQGCVCTHNGRWLLAKAARDKGRRVRGEDKEDKVWGNASTKNSKSMMEGTGLEGH